MSIVPLAAISQTEIPWNSTNTTADKWITCNVWVRALLVFNAKNPIGLEINTKGTVAEIWELFKARYKVALDIVRLNAK